MMRRKDYQKKNLCNPYFSQEKKKIRVGAKFLFFCFCAFLILFLYLGDSLDYFKIKNIEVVGNTTISKEGIESLVKDQLGKRRFFIFGQDSILFFSKRQIKKNIAEKYLTEGLKINKNLPDTVIIEITEKSYSVVWVVGSKKYYLDPEGVAVKEVDQGDVVFEEGGSGTGIIRSRVAVESYPVVYELSASTQPAVGDIIASKDLVTFVVSLSRLLKSNADFEVSYYSILGPDQLALQTVEGWQVFFRTTDSVTQQVNRLLLILKEEVSNRNNLEYIDLRFDEKVFYK